MARRSNTDLLLLVALFFLLKGKFGGLVVPTIPKPKPVIVPKPPPWWDTSIPEPPGWPAGAPWPPFDENGVWTMPKDVGKVRFV